MAAIEFCDPVAMLVNMEIRDCAFHGLTTWNSSAIDRATRAGREPIGSVLPRQSLPVQYPKEVGRGPPGWKWARVAGCEPGEFVYTFGDVHLYLNHLDQADRQLAREPLPLPRVHLHGERRSLLDFRYEDVELLDYRHHPASSAPVSV